MKKNIIAILLALVFTIALFGCGGSSDPNVTDPANTDSGTPVPTQADVTDTVQYNVNIGFLKGPTGIGASYMLEQNESGSCRNIYNVSMESDPTNITSALISGSLDIAAVPTNVAAALYNKTDGNIQIIALNTLGVLYILENGNSISSVADLQGKTIYATGQGANPEYVLNYILRQNGLEPGVDVTIEYMDGGELMTQMAAGNLDICMLPVPNSTSVLLNNTDVRVALSISDEWEAVTNDESVLTQGCIVARMDTENIDAIIENFLADYEASILYMSNPDNISTAAELAVQFEIVGSVPIATAAIPDSNIVFIAGADTMKSYLTGYFNVLFDADPTSIGGAIPDDTFYFES